MYSTATNRVCGIMYLMVSPTTIFGLVNTNEGTHRPQSLIQFFRVIIGQIYGAAQNAATGRQQENVSQSDKYAASEGLGAAQKKTLATWRLQETVTATSS